MSQKPIIDTPDNAHFKSTYARFLETAPVGSVFRAWLENPNIKKQVINRPENHRRFKVSPEIIERLQRKHDGVVISADAIVIGFEPSPKLLAIQKLFQEVEVEVGKRYVPDEFHPEILVAGWYGKVARQIPRWASYQKRRDRQNKVPRKIINRFDDGSVLYAALTIDEAARIGQMADNCLAWFVTRAPSQRRARNRVVDLSEEYGREIESGELQYLVDADGNLQAVLRLDGKTISELEGLNKSGLTSHAAHLLRAYSHKNHFLLPRKGKKKNVPRRLGYVLSHRRRWVRYKNVLQELMNYKSIDLSQLPITDDELKHLEGKNDIDFLDISGCANITRLPNFKLSSRGLIILGYRSNSLPIKVRTIEEANEWLAARAAKRPDNKRKPNGSAPAQNAG